MKPLLTLLILLMPALVAAECEEAFDGIIITRDTVLCNRAFDVPSGITIKTSNITLDCNGAIIRGTGLQDGQGMIIDHANDVTIKNCNILNFDAGIYVKDGHRNNIYHNALLKNKVGIRLLRAFENRFESNADKSIIKPVSALASKFNSFWLTNKDIERDFCAVNLCNTAGVMNPCEDDDEYCSPSCSQDNDNDCLVEQEETTPIIEYPRLTNESSYTPKQVPPAIIQEPASVPSLAPRPVVDGMPQKTRFWLMALLFIAAYLIGFLSFQHHNMHHGARK